LFGEFANLLLNEISLASSWDLRATGSEDEHRILQLPKTETIVQTNFTAITFSGPAARLGRGAAATR
jgi:hypothetical protein